MISNLCPRAAPRLLSHARRPALPRPGAATGALGALPVAGRGRQGGGSRRGKRPFDLPILRLWSLGQLVWGQSALSDWSG